MVDRQAQQLTDALKAGDFEMAERLATEYGNCASASSDAAALQQALDILNDCLHLTRVLRAHLATQVRANSSAAEYEPTASAKPLWQFEG